MPKVLIVSDLPHMTRLIQVYLDREGYEPASVSVKCALRGWVPEWPDLIVTGDRLIEPQALEALMPWLKECGKPVILISEGGDGGCKPFNPDMLTSIMGRALRNQLERGRRWDIGGNAKIEQMA